MSPIRSDHQGKRFTERRSSGLQPSDAARRVPVRLPDGRTGRLQWCAKYGRLAVVQLPGGARVRCHVDELTREDET